MGVPEHNSRSARGAKMKIKDVMLFVVLWVIATVSVIEATTFLNTGIWTEWLIGLCMLWVGTLPLYWGLLAPHFEVLKKIGGTVAYFWAGAMLLIQYGLMFAVLMSGPLETLEIAWVLCMGVVGYYQPLLGLKFFD